MMNYPNSAFLHRHYLNIKDEFAGPIRKLTGAREHSAYVVLDLVIGRSSMSFNKCLSSLQRTLEDRSRASHANRHW